MRVLLTATAILLAAAPGAQAQATVTVSEQDCSRLIRHVASADVNYQPGVDVNGNSVAPADLNGGSQIAAPDVISFPLTLDLSERLGLPADTLARPVIGDVTVASGGQVTFNGKPLTSDEQRELAQQCQRNSR